ncbi:MAG: hypothetical protein QJR08_00250 [Bacillota bacterium]|nr:hypothetical protein [Bacillota bacterium]
MSIGVARHCAVCGRPVWDTTGADGICPFCFERCSRPCDICGERTWPSVNRYEDFTAGEIVCERCAEGARARGHEIHLIEVE